MQANTTERVQRHRDALRASGLRPMQVWVPDTRRAGFAAECRRQSRLVALADAQDAGILDFLDDALADVDGWKA
ncbi:MAG: antitoxin MazE family protein [Rhodocyclaceae bacterium]|nr:antitoxin MazE family protein [Rhodocyclaceae bacterium]